MPPRSLDERPYHANRDGRCVLTLAELQRRRRTGYRRYDTWPAEHLAIDHPD